MGERSYIAFMRMTYCCTLIAMMLVSGLYAQPVERAEPGSATSEFFFCVGDQHELDYGGSRNSDLQGFAAFGTRPDRCQVSELSETDYAFKKKLNFAEQALTFE